MFTQQWLYVAVESLCFQDQLDDLRLPSLASKVAVQLEQTSSKEVRIHFTLLVSSLMWYMLCGYKVLQLDALNEFARHTSFVLSLPNVSSPISEDVTAHLGAAAKVCININLLSCSPYVLCKFTFVIETFSSRVRRTAMVLLHSSRLRLHEEGEAARLC